MRPQNMLSASLLAAGLALPLSSACYANIVISIDKSTQQMAVAVDGTQRYEWPVSTGRPGYDTPNGTFKPNRMDADHYLPGVGQCADAAFDLLRHERATPSTAFSTSRTSALRSRMAVCGCRRPTPPRSSTW